MPGAGMTSMIGRQMPGWEQPGQDPMRMEQAAPKGYAYDKVKGGYVNTIGSAGDQLDEATRLRGQQSTLFSKLTSAIDGIGGSGGSTSGSPLQMGGDGGAASAAVNSAADAANSSAFAKAKSTAGMTARSAVDALHGEMASRGIAGSGTEGRGLVDKLSAATNSIGDENNAEMQSRVGIAAHQQDLGQQANEANLSAGVTQRGQDVQAEAARAQIASQRQTALMSMLSSLTRPSAGMAY